MKPSQSKQKSYVDKRKPHKFVVGYHDFLRVTTTTEVGRDLESKKLFHKFIGPYKILMKIRPVAYEVNQPIFITCFMCLC